MQLQVTVPDGTSIDGVRAALAHFGAVVKAKPAARIKAQAGQDWEPVIARHRETGEVIREIDGVSVQKAIAKIMTEVNKGKNSDGRHKGDYPNYPAMEQRLAKDPTANPGHDYAKVFCQNLHHKPAQYVNGVTA